MAGCYEEIAPYRVKQGRFESGERFARVVDAAGVVAFDPSVYAVHVLRAREVAANTSEAHLRAIVLAMNWAAARRIDLRARLESVDLLSAEEILDLRDALRRRARTLAPTDMKSSSRRREGKSEIVASATFYNRCHFVAEYLTWQGERSLARMRTSDPRLPVATRRLERFRTLMLENLPKRRPPQKEGADEAAQATFLEVIRPGSPRNPFQKQHQSRNYALLLLYYETGMRRSEALKLKGEHLIGFGGGEPMVRVIRSPDDKDDPRPSEPSVKTLGRDLPISRELAEALLEWMKIRRDPSRYGHARKTGFIFVARDGTPMATRTVNEMFELLRKCIGELPASLTPHALRHTANDRFSAAADEEGLNEAEEKQARNYAMGWVKESNQGDNYTARHTRRKAQSIALRMQEKSHKGRNR